MHGRLLAIVSAVCLFPTAAAQAQLQPALQRVRLTGSNLYTRADEVRIEPGRVSGTSIIDMDDTTVRLKGAVPGEILTVPRPGRRLVGDALSVANGSVTIRVENGNQTIMVPLNAIGELELSRGRRHSRPAAVLGGLAVGFGTFWGAGALTVNRCGLDCDGGILAAMGGGVIVGSIVWARLGAERWERAPVTWLPAHFQAP